MNVSKLSPDLGITLERLLQELGAELDGPQPRQPSCQLDPEDVAFEDRVSSDTSELGEPNGCAAHGCGAPEPRKRPVRRAKTSRGKRRSKRPIRVS